MFSTAPGPRWPSGKVSVAGPAGSKPETRFHRRTSMLAGLEHAKSSVAQSFPANVVWKGGKGGADCGSKSRGPFQDSPRVASKRDVNI
ncbi:hypothetical protein AVEN_110631-1 [Araneus ventricosus]|uniref:Uncharacterized protein n=1 Tax=Araneus ventricosus TaxID=182803 RepID=A0A4Y2AUV7_ARAVE|nr:hypothetical protein AVEN_110631-1 [Araneus ventricosus]